MDWEGRAFRAIIIAMLVLPLLLAMAQVAQAWSGSGIIQLSGSVGGEAVTGSGQWSYTTSGSRFTGQAEYQGAVALPAPGGGCSYSVSSMSIDNQETWTGTVQGNIATVYSSGTGATGALTLTCSVPGMAPIVSSTPASSRPFSYQFTLNLSKLQTGAAVPILSGSGVVASLTQTSGFSVTTAVTSVTSTATTSIGAGASSVISSLTPQDQSELLALAKMFGQSVWQSTSTTFDCLQQLVSSLTNTCTENNMKFTFSVVPPSLQELVIETTTDMSKDAILKFFGEEFIAPYSYIEAGQQVYVVGQGVYEISQILQVPLGATSTSTVGSIEIGMEPTADALFKQQLMMTQGIFQNDAAWAASHQDSVKVLQLQLSPAGQVVSVTDEPTEGIQLDCASSESCTPQILARVSALHSVFVLAIPLPSNLTAGRLGTLTNVPLNQSGVNSSALDVTIFNQTVSQPATTVGQQSSSGNELLGLVFLLLVFLFFLFIAHGIYRAVKDRLAGAPGGRTDGGRKDSGKRAAAPPQEGGEDNDLKILKVRYAKGEITKKKFDQMKKDLE